MAKKYGHLMFDFDRTFWDVDSNQRGALEELYERFGMGRFFGTKERMIANFKEINEELWRRYRDGEIDKLALRTGRFVALCRSVGCEDGELANALDRGYVETVPNHNRLLPYSVEILDYLTGKGYDMSLVTNGLNEVQLNKIEKCGLAKYFRVVTTSDLIGVNKPDPRIFEAALERAGVSRDETVMIGDDPYSDIFGATQAGLDTVYLNASGRAHDLHPTYEIRHLSELERIF